MNEPKQVIIIRKDLKMRRGKEIAQGAHASMGALFSLMTRTLSGDLVTRTLRYSLDSDLGNWLDGRFTKVTLAVNSEQELIELAEKADKAAMEFCLITDSGLTEFHGTPTKTALAIGPHAAEEIDKITGHLKLY